MSRTLCCVLSQINQCKIGTLKSASLSKTGKVDGIFKVIGVQTAAYSKRSNSEDLAQSFTVVKSKVRIDDDFNSFEGGPNWELLSPRSNRFFFPNSSGPAWQGANTTINTEVPLSDLIDFEGQESSAQANDKLKFNICVCPMLIKNSLHEIFPAPEVVSSKKLTLMILSFDGDIERGAAKFVLAAREISERLRLHGYWTDFMNPFSGKPFFSWANGKNLYKIDERFRGLNMQLIDRNSCTVISSARNIETSFSGAIYTTAPSEYEELKSIIQKRLFGSNESA